ncbi:MAG TPA: hemerythrin domain-containing protein [Candidatus Binatia bacterium]|jgi:hemerythrin-like domain-containing protein
MPDAVQLLRQDHQKVQELFKQFEESEDRQTKKQIAATALNELKVHAALEEELFYPAVRQEIDEEEKVDEAEEEHHVAKLLISELEKMTPSDDHFDAKFKVLAESVKHHIEEEESEVIPEIESEIDGAELGERMAERKEELQHKMSDGASPGGRSRKSSGRRGKNDRGRKSSRRSR